MKISDDLMMQLEAIFSVQGAGETLNTLDTASLKSILNKIFGDKTCVNVIYTQNTDNMFFGVNVNPTIPPIELMSLLFSDGPIKLNRYTLEIDSKLFTTGMGADEISVYILHEISSMMCETAPVDNIRNIIDLYIACEDEIISIKDSVNYSQIIIFAVKDALTKLSSILYKEDEDIVYNEYIDSEELMNLLRSALGKVRTSVFGVGSDVKEPNLVQIKWAFDLYRDVKHLANTAIAVLQDSKKFTGSKLQNIEIDKTIAALQRAGSEVALESTRILAEAKSGGLFNNLKRSGLRSIEDDLYEFKMRVKNADTEEEAYYALRQINTRINLLEDYIYSNDLSENEARHWRDVIMGFRELREQLLSRKIVHQKTYGLFYDYDQLDQL